MLEWDTIENVIIFLSGYNARLYECTVHLVHLLIPDKVSIRIGFNQSIKAICEIAHYKFCLSFLFKLSAYFHVGN